MFSSSKALEEEELSIESVVEQQQLAQLIGFIIPTF